MNKASEWFEINKERQFSKEKYMDLKISSEYKDCSTCFSFDLYNLCFFSCIYCFAFYQKANNPSFDMKTNVKSSDVNRVIDIFEGKYPDNPYYQHFIKDKKVLHIGGMADNFCGYEKKFKKGIKLIEYFLKTGYPIIISSKGDFLNYPEYQEIFDKYKETACCAIQSSIITYDKQVASKIEIGVPTPKMRFENLKKLSAMGYYTILRLRPFIVGISDKTLDNMLQNMVDNNIHAISTEFFCLDMRTNDEVRSNFDTMSEVCGFDIIKYYRALSPTERGSYLRLNRKVKEQFIKKMYKFCVENNKVFACSDPDFKELNMTGSCCGLPSDKIKWGLLVNYQMSQLTNLLRLLRIRFWKSNGKDKLLYFSDVFKAGDSEWMDDRRFIGDSVKEISYSSSKRNVLNFRKLFIMDWNNLRSAANPYNYFHGKLKPSGNVDEQGNIIYEYVASEYEKDWVKEGLLK